MFFSCFTELSRTFQLRYTKIVLFPISTFRATCSSLYQGKWVVQQGHYEEWGYSHFSRWWSLNILLPARASEQGNVIGSVRIYIICYSTGRSDIRDNYISRGVGIAAVKSHEAKPSVISPLYRKRVEYIPEFHDCPCYIPWLHSGGAISLFSHW